MMKHDYIAFCYQALLSVSLAVVHLGEEAEVKPLPAASEGPVDFVRAIEPIFKEKCHVCHGAEQQLGGLRLDSAAAALAGGHSGAVIKPGNSAESRLVHLVAGLEKGKIMPMTGDPLSSEQVGLLRGWIDQGAAWPQAAGASNTTVEASSARPKSKHWAFKAPRRPPVPKVRPTAWIRNPIDSFVLARLETGGIAPSPETDRSTLIRRVSFDLTGLPPTPEEVERFLADKRPDAYRRLGDRLLASPHYGEKWARQWLDLARYADSDGYEKDNVRPHAWRWRQWVIDALNRNMPFDQFTIEQIAGDLSPNATLEQKIATGFHRNTLTNREGGVNKEEYRVEQVVDRTSTVGTVWLGLTIGCARCHDHKYDPISQKEFYQLYAFFNSAAEVNVAAPSTSELGFYLQSRPEYRKRRNALLAEYPVSEYMSDWERGLLEAASQPGLNPPYDTSWDLLGILIDEGQEILRTKPNLRSAKQQSLLTDFFVAMYGEAVGKEKYKQLGFGELKSKLDKLNEQFPELSEAQTLAVNPSPPKSHLLLRGDFCSPGMEVRPNVPAVLGSPTSDPISRLDLARWLVSRENPLTARVTVNRYWQEFFGHGLVETSQDFGTRAGRSSHPELLDWLATGFVTSGWDVKKLHRLIVESATYRQSSRTRADLQTLDPDNRLLARQVRLRLSAELIRDSVLSCSGLLDPTVGGKSVRPPMPQSVLELGFDPFSEHRSKWQESRGTERYRRGLYILFLRTTPYPQLMSFDAPDSLLSCSRRERSTTPLQALNLLNDPVFLEAAQVLAARIVREQSGGLNERLDHAFRICLGRSPKVPERDELIRFYARQKEILQRSPELLESLFPAQKLHGIDPTEAALWVGISRLLLNLDEFITRG